jgi:hypothetical protein
MPSSPAFTIDPTGFTKAGSIHKGSTVPFDDVWKQAAPGDQILVKPGTYRRMQLKKSPRSAGAPPIAFIAEVPGTVIIDRDVKVGSTDTLLIGSGQGDVLFDGLELIADDRAGIKTEGPGGAKAVSFKNCSVHGIGDAYTQDWRDDVKWLSHGYLTAKWSEIGMKYYSCWDEHARYPHNIQGNHIYSGGSVKHCGRTALQIVNRMKESGTPMAEGKGNVTISYEEVTDVCLGMGGGGSAYTLRGGMPNSVVTLTGCMVRLGCDSKLALPFNENITGALVMDSGPESKPGAGDAAWPGGTKELHVIGCSFEVGKVFPGVGGARRPNVKVGDVGLFVLQDSHIIQHPGAHQIALEIEATCKSFKFAGTNEVVGQVKFWNSAVGFELFQTWADFIKAHKECAA